MFDKLESVERRYFELESKLADPSHPESAIPIVPGVEQRIASALDR